MKNKFLLLFFFSLVSTIILGQITKGNFIIEGSGDLTLINNKIKGNDGDDASWSTLFIAAGPKITYFLSDRFAIGGGIGGGRAFKGSRSYSINGNTRFYLTENSTNAWFLKAEVNFWGNRLESGKTKRFSANTGLGLDIFLSPNVALESTLTLGFTEYNGLVEATEVEFLIGTGLKFFLNKLPKKKVRKIRNSNIQKGNMFLGLTSGFISFRERNNTTNISVNLAPQFGKFLSDRLLLGGLVDLYVYHAPNQRSFLLDATPFLRYYLKPEKKKFVPFGEIGGGIAFDAQNGGTVSDGNLTQTNLLIIGGVGIDYFIRPNVAVEIKANYKYRRQMNVFIDNIFGINIGFNFFLDRS